MGFQLGLAPGWERSGGTAPDGVNFVDPTNRAALLVHVGRARSTNVDAAAGAVMFDLTGGSGVTRAADADTKLAGRSARRIRGSFAAAGATQEIEAIVMLDASRVWVMALAGPAERVDADQADFDRMAGTFRLLGHLPALPAQVAQDEPAPAFPELDRVKGPVVLNFFATWCAPCRQEMPLLAARASSSQGRFAVLAIATQDDPANVPRYLNELGVNLPVGYDADGRLGQSYLLPGVPATFFLDGNHVVRGMVYGPLTAEALSQGIEQALGQ